MLINQVEELIRHLEQEELEQTDNGAKPELYIQLFAAYLYKMDLSSARYLWKRIPQSTVSGNKELEKLHEVYIALWNNKSSDFFKALNFAWSPDIQPIISELEEKVREDVLDLIGKAYTSLFENVFIEMTNISSEKVKDICSSLEWDIVDNNGPRLIYPKNKTAQKSISTSSEDQLYILTEFVSFLEN